MAHDQLGNTDPVDLAERRIRRAQEGAESWEPLAAGSNSEFRVDLERLRFCPSFARLAEVTQVVTANATDGVVHNRLTHSIKVTALARALAVQLVETVDPAVVDAWGGLDHVVAQAGAVAHDLGHPPFGHLGEQTLDRIAQSQFGLTDGFEGNAQTFRIITELEVFGSGTSGLNLTTAVRAAVLKYPWGRTHVPNPHPLTWNDRPRGANPGGPGEGAVKFNAYLPELDEMEDVVNGLGLPPGRQSLECSVMDLADDIAYSLHDLEDFHRSGVLQYSPIAGEFRAWRDDAHHWSEVPGADLERLHRTPGAGLERLRRNIETKDAWVYDLDLFWRAVDSIRHEFVDGVLIQPYDGSRLADRIISGFVDRWIQRFSSLVELNLDPNPRSPLVTVSPPAWHEIQVLKFVHQYFVLHRPDLAMVQRGQSMILAELVRTFDDWLSDRLDALRAPRRLLDLVGLAEEGYREVSEQHPERLDGHTSDTELARMARGRGIIDFVAGLTDSQAIAYAGRLSSGSSGLLWASGVL